MSESIIVAPSLLSADFGKLSDEISRMEKAGADWFHLDVMDGHFVPNITIGPFIVEAIRKRSSIPLDVHLMIENPIKYLDDFSNAGADSITVHIEACKENIDEVIGKIRSLKKRVGVAFRPKTSLPESISASFIPKVDMILIMSVEPGFGGQSFMPEILPKIKRLKNAFSGDIEVDGGINSENAPQVIEKGANVLVSGSYLFKSEKLEESVALLRRRND